MSRVSNSKATLQTVKCFCGDKILLLPDVKAMSKAITDHAAKHKEQFKDPKKAKEEEKRVTDYLIIAMFNEICREEDAAQAQKSGVKQKKAH